MTVIEADIRDNKIRIQDPEPEVAAVISKTLTFFNKKAFIVAAKLPEWQRPDPNVRYFRRYARSIVFGCGFLERVNQKLREYGYRVDTRIPVETVEYHHLIHGRTLDPLQVEGNRKLLSCQRGAIELSVASGKTFTMANLAACFVRQYPDQNVMVVVPKRQLLYQVHEQLATVLPQHRIGLLGDGKRRIEQITVAIPNTVTSAGLEESVKDYVDGGIGCLIVDEAHHAVSNMWQKLFDMNPHARIWGLSGKLVFEDEIATADIEEILGQPLMRARNEVRLCPVDVKIYDLESYGWKKDKSPGQTYDGMPVYFTDGEGEGSSWHEGVYRMPGPDGTGVYIGSNRVDIKNRFVLYGIAEDFGIVLSKDRNMWAVSLVKRILQDPKAKVAITVRRNVHLLMIANLLKDAGIKCLTVSGRQSGSKQQERWDKLNSDDHPIRVIVSQCTCLKEGTDVPSLTDLIRLDGSVGDQMNEQLKGRVERACEGKDKGTVHIPGDFHNKSLRKRLLKIKKYYQKGKCRVITVT